MAEGSTPRRLPSADPRNGSDGGLRGRLAAGLLAELEGLTSLFPGSSGDLSAETVRGWPAYRGEECPVCGAFTGSGRLGVPLPSCASCATLPPFDFARSLFAYEGCVRNGIRAAKYARHAVPVGALAERLLEAIHGKWSDRFPAGFRPAVVPVPIRTFKYFQRGFNLPALVGHSLSRLAGWPFSPLVLRRTGGSRPQAGMRRTDREENVREAFDVPPGRRPPSEILLVDDVYTSGATARACSHALKTAGAGHIVVLTVARTVL
ncbi:MAG TPA: ComF family protein [Candidatus Limnocylindrales bacterium]|nr:ComF family protein [Candidatus Limnocylindrales bacterium]